MDELQKHHTKLDKPDRDHILWNSVFIKFPPKGQIDRERKESLAGGTS